MYLFLLHKFSNINFVKAISILQFYINVDKWAEKLINVVLPVSSTEGPQHNEYTPFL